MRVLPDESRVRAVDARDSQHRAQLTREAEAPGMRQTVTVEETGIRAPAKTPEGGEPERPLAAGEVAGDLEKGRPPGCRGDLDHGGRSGKQTAPRPPASSSRRRDTRDRHANRTLENVWLGGWAEITTGKGVKNSP